MLADCPMGLYEKALPPAEWPVLLSQARDLGFDFVEMSIDESEERLARLKWSTAQRQKLVEAVLHTGMRIPSICLSGNRRYPLGSNDPKLCAAGIELVRDAVDFAVDVGVRIVMIAGYDVYYEESTPETKERFRENLGHLVRYAAGRGVTLSVEIMDTQFMSSISRFLHLRERIQSPWLTVYPDLGNLSGWNENAAEELELGLRLGVVSAVHLKDTRPVACDSPGQFRDLPFGEGCVDFPRLFRVLERYGFAGQLVLEMWYHGKEETQSIAEAKAWIERKLKA